MEGFGIGVASNGDGADIEDSQVQHPAGDGFFITSHTKITNANITGVTFTGNRASGNGGWGFNMPVNEIDAETGSVFNNIADGDGKVGSPSRAMETSSRAPRPTTTAARAS